MDESSLQVRDNADRNRFEAETASGTAVLDYDLQGDRMIFTSTRVPEEEQGKGIGSELVREALERVRERELKVVPQCPFVRDYIADHPEYAALVAAR